jgi:hypothetical protein
MHLMPVGDLWKPSAKWNIYIQTKYIECIQWTPLCTVDTPQEFVLLYYCMLSLVLHVHPSSND